MARPREEQGGVDTPKHEELKVMEVKKPRHSSCSAEGPEG